MTSIRINKLAAIGPDLESAELDLGRGLTVVYGASNTGKTYVFDLINYLLGASNLKHIDESAGYDTGLLSLLTPRSPEGLVLERSIEQSKSAAKFRVYEGLQRSGRPRVLSPRHQKTGNDISTLFLAEMGIGESWVRSNDRNETVSLTLRLLSRLFLVSETDIVSEAPPALSGQFISKTTERSVLKFVLQGNDDSDLPRTTKAATAERQRNQGRLAAMEQIVGELRQALGDWESSSDAQARLVRLEQSIEGISNSLDGHLEEQARLKDEIRQLQRQYEEQRHRVTEIADLLSNFRLLLQKYDSDLERLGMLEEAGTLLGYFDVGDCVFCGSTPENQSTAAHRAEDRTLFADAVRAEQSKTLGLRVDLALAIQDLGAERESGLRALAVLEAQVEGVRDAARALDDRLSPQRGELRELVAAKGDLERRIAAHEQIEHIETLKVSLGSVDEPASVPATALGGGVAQEFGELLFGILEDWRVPELRHVSFDAESCDISMNGIPRSSHGKGMRAILHAAFTVGLAQWCIVRNLPHPGFVVLDSPLVTYKEPESAEDERIMGNDVATHFFRYMASRFLGQAVILENVAPPSEISEEATVYEFTKSRHGRYGFFPVVPVRELASSGAV
ncbi:hypothetical protein OG992_28835 [Micromonospora sp. NBC_00362]|uniref:hypothetical protein n=1 Tax=Micromonospora sp. NBC_00362 TaxID=2975975 RepID=UPI002258858D|nr:hypothetical protein [Micromonospora sp. NBC_00362]MCX5121190.1 hypothetical protein [Micromonospora sp. NBC_00362]